MIRDRACASILWFLSSFQRTLCIIWLDKEGLVLRFRKRSKAHFTRISICSFIFTVRGVEKSAKMVSLQTIASIVIKVLKLVRTQNILAEKCISVERISQSVRKLIFFFINVIKNSGIFLAKHLLLIYFEWLLFY